MALTALFLQPTQKMPSVIVLDEPELGLHPYAISVFAGLVKSVAANTQVILATQSTGLVDEFEPGQIVVLELDEKSGTQCKRLEAEKLRGIADSFRTPEEIDDDPNSAPSKRILQLSQRYQKVLHGNIAAQRIGLTLMRQKCPHFDEWLERLESLGQKSET